jgi:hypothetical protein
VGWPDGDGSDSDKFIAVRSHGNLEDGKK